MPTCPIRQTHFQWFQDDGPPDTCSPLRSEDSNLAAVEPGAYMLLRVQSQYTGIHAISSARRLQYRRVGTNKWWPVGAFVVYPYAAPVVHPSTWFSDGDPITTQRLSTPTDAMTSHFIGGRAKQSETETDAQVYGVKQFTEDVWCISVDPQCPAGLDLELRATKSGQPYERHNLYPRLTVRGYQPTEMDIKANQLFADPRPLARLEFRRDNFWWDLSDRLVFPFTITRRLKAVTTADLTLDNADGALARDNMMSTWNYDEASHHDPLLDEGRVIRLRQGLELHPSLAYGLGYECPSPGPTRPTSLRGSELTDGGFGQPRNEHDDAWVGWQGVAATVTFTLSPPRDIHSVAVSMLSKAVAGVLLPTSASVTLVGSAGAYTAPLPADHLRDDPGGRRQLLYGLDLHQPGVSQVIFTFQPKSPEAWVCLDEIALYDASTTADVLKTTFTGILGDEITQQATDRGAIRLGQVRDTTKRLADLFIEAFEHYENVALEAIIEDLLINPRYEGNVDTADFYLDTTGFEMPRWTEQNASLLDACAQLAKMIGWVFEADDDGIYALHDLEWTVQTGEETYLADRELLGWAPSVSGLNLRNRIVVKSRDARNREISAVVEDPESIARYGPRLFTLFEPALRTARLARRLAESLRRDYSWVQPTGAGVATGDVFMRPGRVVSVVHSGCTHSGPDRLYRVEAVTHRQTGNRHGEHTMALELRGYRHRTPSAPDSLVAAPSDASVSLDWAPLSDHYEVVAYQIHQADTMAGSYTDVACTASPPTLISSLTNAQTYWFKVAGYTEADVLGEFAGPVPCVPKSGGGPPIQAEEAWQPQSLSASLIMIWGIQRPQLVWYPRLPAPEKTCYNIYRSRVSTGPYSLIATRTQPGSNPVIWVDYGFSLWGDLFYEVTFYDPASDFESWPSSIAHVAI